MSCYIIAEAGVNHNGSEELAFQLVDAAVMSGADAVKFQTFKAEALVQKGAKTAEYQKNQTGDVDQFAMLKKLELSEKVHVQLARYCAEKGIEFLSTGFDEGSIDMLLELGISRLKAPSGELTNKPYITYMAEKNVPMILSTGMATMAEVEDAVAWVRDTRERMGFKEPLAEMLTLLHCTSNYPAPLESVNLNAMLAMKSAFDLPVGYSDHTAGILISPMAVAMGATVIEKHFTLDKSMPGPDHQASLEPAELQAMISNIREVEKSLGTGIKEPTESELEVRSVVRRGPVLTRDMQEGDVLSTDDIALLRPEGEIAPKDVEQLYGKAVVCNLKAGAQLKRADIKA